MNGWDLILHIREQIRKIEKVTSTGEIESGSSCLDLRIDSLPPGTSLKLNFSDPVKLNGCMDTICFPDPFHVNMESCKLFNAEDTALLTMYLPYAVLPYFARKLGRVLVVTHFAQTLDGRIASVTGDSRWIGNRQNLIHAHRMRALMDGILIGAGTLKNDNPRLTVRHVDGNDPCRIIVGGDDLDFTRFEAMKGEAMIFCNNHFNSHSNHTSYRLPKTMNLYNTGEILERLFEAGICSVYIEGGSYTTSHFLTQDHVDQVQIHFAPVILGSGISGFNFSGAELLNEAIRFKTYRYRPVGNEVMFIGELT